MLGATQMFAINGVLLIWVQAAWISCLLSWKMATLMRNYLWLQIFSTTVNNKSIGCKSRGGNFIYLALFTHKGNLMRIHYCWRTTLQIKQNLHRSWSFFGLPEVFNNVKLSFVLLLNFSVTASYLSLSTAGQVNGFQRAQSLDNLTETQSMNIDSHWLESPINLSNVNIHIIMSFFLRM